jgi:pantoate--beta-alanine ligase
VVSIFVNPAQFGPREDFKKYPRDLKRDAGMCAREEVDIIFYPNVVEIYPEDYRTYITVEELSNCLCGRFRPGHFKGVATVVSKLFNIVQPDTSYFGQKDAQQSIIIKRMVRDLNIPVKIKVLPTIRERDGLAMSSRNSYLSPQKRKDALIAYESLNLAKDLIKSGIRDTAKIISRMERLIKKKKDSAKIDYISIVDLENLKPLKRIFGNCLIVLAIFIGKTRLIDNFILRGPEARRTNT